MSIDGWSGLFESRGTRIAIRNHVALHGVRAIVARFGILTAAFFLSRAILRTVTVDEECRKSGLPPYGRGCLLKPATRQLAAKRCSKARS